MRRSVLVEGYGIPLGPGTGRDPAPRTNLAGTHPGPAGRSRPAPGEITFISTQATTRKDPPDPHQPRTARADRAQGREDADPGQPTLASRAHERLAQRVQPVPTLLRTPREGDRRVLRPADAIIAVRSLIRRAWITHRWDTRPTRQP